ncbi:MAG TPA: transcriptional activator RfaH [Xanthobacteraceae bacterium]|nr:transcriptional activator RfaH [Xanthobacteraceae bacterium]
MTMRWYVVQTQPHCETKAKIHLGRQGFVTYLPRYLRQRRHARRCEIVPRPLFPNYLFVAFDIARDRWRSIHSTVGVNHLVMAGEEPAPVPDGVVEEIRGREGRDGYVVLGLPAGAKIGGQVRLIDGIFADTRGILERIVDTQRVAILLQLLGREVRVSVPSATICIA